MATSLGPDSRVPLMVSAINLMVFPLRFLSNIWPGLPQNLLLYGMEKAASSEVPAHCTQPINFQEYLILPHNFFSSKGPQISDHHHKDQSQPVHKPTSITVTSRRHSLRQLFHLQCLTCIRCHQHEVKEITLSGLLLKNWQILLPA